jgi:4-amino-4-deoxy-L-arabinose transferase-like glycosyltransferase
MGENVIGDWRGVWTGFLEKDAKGRIADPWKWILGLLALAFLLRLPLLFFPEVIHNDGTEYIRHAKLIFAGNWVGGKAPPLFPASIALFRLFTGDFERAGILASVLFGSLLILPVFSLGRTLFNERVGVLAALFAAVQPFLYIASGSVLTESVYFFLLTSSVLFGWKAFSEERPTHLFLFGLFTALSYLTRPEAIGFLFIFAAWVLLVPPAEGRRSWPKKAGMVFAAVLCFLVFSSPYLIQIRRETGRWEISKKASVSVAPSSKDDIYYQEGARKVRGINLFFYVRHPLEAGKQVGFGFVDSVNKFQQSCTPLLFVILLLGLVLDKGKFFCRRGSLYLFSFMVFFFGFVYPSFWVTRRFTSHMVPLALPWAAAGFGLTAGWLQRHLGKDSLRRTVPLLLLAAVLGGLFLQGRVLHSREHRTIQREVGIWMKGHLPPDAVVMSKLPQEAFYAERPWVRMPPVDYEAVLKLARSKGARYLVTDEEIEKDSPGFSAKRKDEDLSLLTTVKRKERRMEIFEVLPEKGKE